MYLSMYPEQSSCYVLPSIHRPPPPPTDIRDLLSLGYKMPLRRARPGEKPERKKRNRLTGRAAGQHTSYFADPSPPTGQGTAPTI